MPSMDSAPRDRNILVKSEIHLYSNIDRGYRPAGYYWVEAWWDRENNCWEKWCGNYRTTTTTPLFPVAWAELPKE